MPSAEENREEGEGQGMDLLRQLAQSHSLASMSVQPYARGTQIPRRN